MILNLKYFINRKNVRKKKEINIINHIVIKTFIEKKILQSKESFF